MTDHAGGSRRAFLRAAGVAGVAGVAGCLGGSGTNGTSTSPSASDDAVSILAAGSLQHALSEGLADAVDVPLEVETHGSATVARLISEGQRDPDVVTVADTALFESPLSPPWYSVFTSNAVVLAYDPDTAGGRAVADAENWYDPLIAGDAALGRTDPDQDPLGYRTLFALDLASRYYGVDGLRERLLSRDQTYQESGLVSRFETGSIDAAFAYRNMAVERGYEYVSLPDQINLSDPAYADDWYETVSYELPSGQVVTGGLISYGSTVRHDRESVRVVFAAETTGDYLADAGFLSRDAFPEYVGDAPASVRDATRGT
ncbi:MAG: extracellular solute-binding protein [Halarchaeum sp.]